MFCFVLLSQQGRSSMRPLATPLPVGTCGGDTSQVTFMCGQDRAGESGLSEILLPVHLGILRLKASGVKWSGNQLLISVGLEALERFGQYEFLFYTVCSLYMYTRHIVWLRL